MNSQIGNVSDDDFVIWVFLLAGIAGGGMFGLARLLVPVREWMFEHHLLTTESVVLDLGEGQGLDVMRLVALVAVVVLAIALAVLVARRRKSTTRHDAID